MMTYKTPWQAKKDGFTLVELAIVIAVIAILALIVLVAYPGYQQRTRDNVRKSDLQQVAAALSTYAIQKNNYIEGDTSGCGVYGKGNGWMSVNTAANALYQSSIIECLQGAKVLKAGEFIDPSGCLSDMGGVCGSWNGQPVNAYMKATCTKGGIKATYVFAHIESMPRNDATVDALCDADTVAGFTSDGQKWGTHYGMNYYVQAK